MASNLFLPIYDYMQGRVMEISAKRDTQETHGILNWGSLDLKTRDVAVDLIYRGDYTGESRRFIQRPMIENDLVAFRAEIEKRSNWPGVPADRYQRRISYLRGNL